MYSMFICPIVKKKLKKPSQGLTDGKFNFHVYQAFWSPTVSEESFECHYETGNEQDKFSIAVYRYVKHIRHNMLKAVYKFLELPRASKSIWKEN